ncbi:unnamed protein product [Microthlaspi erraticum]|uniref:Replication protein A 70 kDa DNA-binding subunit B/D first OB fold domain-containing protein n=1 Tax=Microthlaspi erraticum TaxID=1685480 RepID=A0A6D2J6P2_9BRAS|nr:unnamed protein product [Microthlaspi erraticum]
MAAAVHRDLSDLIPWEENPSIIWIKVFRRTDDLDVDGLRGLNFIFVDKHGKKINARTSYRSRDQFRFSLTEGEWREISRFKITCDNWNRSDYKIANHRYMIMLNNDTKLWPLEPLSDHHFFEFTQFEDVTNGNHDECFSLDLIGTISYMGKLSPHPKTLEERRCILFHLKNERNVELYCIACDNFAEDLNENWKSMNRRNVIAVLGEWRITRSKGK